MVGVLLFAEAATPVARGQKVSSDLPIMNLQQGASLGRPLAVGVSLARKRRRDYGEGASSLFAPELIGYGYLPISGALFGRFGARLSYIWDQPEMPRSLRVEERDFMASMEGGLLIEGFVIPSLSMGLGLDARSIKLVTSDPIEKVDSKATHNEFLPYGFAQVGIGFPLARGIFVIEPFFRYAAVNGDKRELPGYGVDLTVQIR